MYLIKYPVVALTLFACISCTEKPAATTIKNDTVAKPKVPPKPTTEVNIAYDTVYSSESAIVYGDTTIRKYKILYTSSKFRPYISFNDFKVNKIDHSKNAELDLNSHEYGRMFRTNLRNAFEDDEANFAGHYTLASWGCGSPCQMNLLIDRWTGKIYDAPNSSLGTDFRVGSRMLIVNPPDENGYHDDCVYCIPEIYVFNEDSKKFTLKNPELQ